jgi:predicted permease
MTWWGRFLHRERLDRQLDGELRYHVDRLVADNIRAGMTPEEARRAARLEFGGIEQMKEECRDARATRWAHDVVQDVRFAARLLRRDRGFTALAVLALALGIGVNTMFFTIVNAMCLRGPLDDPAGLVHVGTVNAAGMPAGISRAEFDDIQASVPSLGRAAAYASAPVALGDDLFAPERTTAAYVSAEAFDLAAAALTIGRGFDAADHSTGAPPVAIVSASLWTRRYDADKGILERSVRIDGRETAIVGVMRDGFRFPGDAEVWLPLAAMDRAGAAVRHIRPLGVFGRLADASGSRRAELQFGLAAARAELGELARRLEREHPQSNEGIRLTAVPFNERFTAPLTHPAWMAFITAGTLVLLIACANVANLLLARAVRRAPEMAMRASLGASRARIVRQLLVECMLLAIVGGTAGLIVSLLGLRVMSAAIPPDALPSWMALRMDGRVFGTLIAVCIGAVFAFGFVPALQTSAASGTLAVRNQARHGSVRRAGRLTTAFLAAQFALTFILLVAVANGLLFREDDEPVLEPSNVLTTWVTLPNWSYETMEQRARLYERLSQEAGAIAGVSPATLASALPFAPVPQQRVVVPGREASGPEAASVAGTVSIGPRYFETFGVGILQGRDFNREERTASAIVNQRFADIYFPQQDPLGQRFLLRGQNDAASGPVLTIVGVAPNIPHARGSDAPVVYQPFAASPPATAVVILRHRAGDTAVAAALRERVRALDGDLPLFRTMSMERVVRDAGWNPRVSAGLINSISTIALILAVVGLYGVTSHAVAARAREIGVRVALGARPRDVRWLVLKRALAQLAVGLPLGVVLTALWNRTFIVQSNDADAGRYLLVLAVVVVTITGVGLLACLLPAQRAARLDPLVTLRQE